MATFRTNANRLGKRQRMPNKPRWINPWGPGIPGEPPKEPTPTGEVAAPQAERVLVEEDDIKKQETGK